MNEVNCIHVLRDEHCDVIILLSVRLRLIYCIQVCLEWSKECCLIE